MELSAIQIVTTVVLIVAAGAVALFCDYLRNRSQQLQELAVESGVRNELSAATPAAPMRAPSAASAAAARTARVMAAREEKASVTSAVAAIPELAAPHAAPKTNLPERHSAEMVKPALASAAEIASVRGAARPRRRPLPPPDATLPRLEDMNPRQALSEWLDQRAAKAPARRAEPVAAPVAVEEIAATVPPPAPTPIVEEPAPVVAAPSADPMPSVHTSEAEEPAPVIAAPLADVAPFVYTPEVEEPAPDTGDIRDILRRARAKRTVASSAVVEVVPVASPTPIAVTAPVSTPAPAPQPTPAPVALPAPAKTVSVVQKQVSVFLNTRKIDTYLREEVAVPEPAQAKAAPTESLTPAEPRLEIVSGAGSSSSSLSNSMEVLLPAGMHDRAVLDRAIATGKPFRGLVVAVGVNDVEGRCARNNDLMNSIGFFVRGLLEKKEFACHHGESEFVILCPELEGAEAQQRLNQIAEQLWDYQLRGVSTWSILFSWGGVDVHCQRLSEAISNASEQMNTTRRGRKMVSVEAFRPLRKVAM
jgi:hypothetical protein